MISGAGVKRWTIVASTLFALAAALWGTQHYDTLSQAQAVNDELLAYEITPARDVVVDVPAGVASVQLTSWAVLPSDGRMVGDQGVPYTLEVELWPRDGEAPRVRRYSAIARVTAVFLPERPELGTPARLSDGPEWLSDPRTLEIDTEVCRARGGRMRVRAIPAEYQHLLVRLSYRFSRGALERSLYRQSLAPAQARELLGGTAALGFADLSRHARERALSFWGRRLTAIGRAEQDYRMRRVLVGARENLAGMHGRTPMTFDLSPYRRAAFNFIGPVRIELFGPPGLSLHVSDGAALVHGARARLADDKRLLLGAEQTLSLDHAGHATLALSQAGLRTVVFDPDRVAAVRFAMRARHAIAQLGDVERRSLPDGNVEVAPDVRRHRYYQLRRDVGIRFGIVPGQGPLRLQLRASRPPPFAADAVWRGRLWASWSGRDGHAGQEGIRVEVRPSYFDDFGELGAASDPHIAFLFPPPNTDEVVLFGDPHLAVSAAVREPGVEASEPEESYRVSLAPDQWLVHAPQMVARYARIEPDNLDALVRAQRQWILRGQVRLVTGGLGEEERPERGLWPRGRPLRRQLWVQRLMQEGGGQASGDVGSEWFELAADVRVRVPAGRTGATELGLRFEVAPEQLGQTLRVRIDGGLRAELPIVVPSGALSLPVQAGAHRLQVEGLGADGVLYGDAPPRIAMEALRAYSVFELGRDGRLEFPITRVSDEPLLLVLFVVTEGQGVPWQIMYSIDGGAAQRRPGVFFREQTERTGLLEGVSGDYETGLLWEAPRERPRRVSQGGDGVAKARIRLGDDLSARKHVLRLWLPPSQTGPERLWVRAVLVGQAGSQAPDEGRQWTREVDDAY